MNTMRSSIVALASVALLAGSSLAFADPPRPAPPPPRRVEVRRPLPPNARLDRPRRPDVDEHHHPGMKDRRIVQEHNKAVQEHRWGEAEKKRADAWRDKYLATLARDRARRRRDEQQALKKRWAHDNWVWNHAEVKSEMELNAWRLARIDALRSLAVKENRQDIVARLNRLRARETSRHNHRMDGYRTRWGHR